MISIERARKLLKDGDKLSDEEVEVIRDEVRTLAELVLEQYQESRRVINCEQQRRAKT